MALDTSLLQSTAGLLRESQNRQADQVKTTDMVNLDRQKMANENWQKVGESASRAIGQGVQESQENKRVMIPITDDLIQGFDKTGDPKTAQILKGMKDGGNSQIAHNFLLGIGRTSSQMEIQQLKNTYKNVGRSVQIQTKDNSGKDILQTVVGAVDDNGEFQWKPMGTGADKFDPQKEKSQGERQSNFQDKQFDTLINNVTKELGSQRNVVGTASRSNRMVNIAMDRLSRPVTFQDLNAVAMDQNTAITGQMATKYGKETLEYKTYAGRLSNWIQQFSGKPEAVATPDIVEKFKRDLMGVKGINDKLISGYMQTREAGHRKTISGNRQDWENFKKSILEGEFETGSEGGDSQAHPRVDPANPKIDPQVSGFKSANDVKEAYKTGKLTLDQAKEELQKLGM